MKVVVIGNGRVGENIASALVDEGHDVTVVDNQAQNLAKTQNTLDVMCIEGNGATVTVQEEAGVSGADMVIAVTPYDELNMLCCLVANRLGATNTIVRVRYPEYHRQMHLIREELGVSMVLNPELTAADEISRVLIFPAAAKVDVFGKGRLELVEYRLPQDSTIEGKTLAEIYKKVKIKFLICAVQRGDEVYIPDGNFILRAGDRIHIAASHKNLERFFRTCGFTKEKEKIRTVMIVGGGHTAYYLAAQLIHMGMKVKIIELDPTRAAQLDESLPEATVIAGDGTDEELLIEEGIRGADAFVTLTGIDEENIILSLFAKDVSDAKIVTKINRDNYLKIAARLDLDCIISPKYLTTSSVMTYVRSLMNAQDSEIESLYHIVGDMAEAVEFRVREEIVGLVGIPLQDVELKRDILICSIIRKREIIIPDGHSTIEKGDLIVVIAKDRHFTKLKDILR